MRSVWSVGAMVAAAAGTFLVATPAFAEAATVSSVQLGIGFRYGAELNDGDFNPWGTGLGLDGGLTLPNSVYVGGVFEYFFGDSVEAADVSAEGNIWQIMAEGGYDIGLGPMFVLRPKVGGGVAFSNSELCVDDDCIDDSSSDFALAPGAKFMVFFPKIRLSADVRYELVFAETTGKALIFSAGIGF